MNVLYVLTAIILMNHLFKHLCANSMRVPYCSYVQEEESNGLSTHWPVITVGPLCEG